MVLSIVTPAHRESADNCHISSQASHGSKYTMDEVCAYTRPQTGISLCSLISFCEVLIRKTI